MSSSDAKNRSELMIMRWI